MTDRSPITAHLGELRRRLFVVLGALVVGTIVAFVFRERIFEILVDPYERVSASRDLVFFRPTEAFSLFMRLSLSSLARDHPARLGEWPPLPP